MWGGSHQCFTELNIPILPLLLPYSSLQTQPLRSFPLLPRFKVGTEMECVEAALKSSFRREVACPLPFSEEFCGSLGVGPCEDFLVDELLDFSNEDGLVEEEDVEKVNGQMDGRKGEGTGAVCGVSSVADSSEKDEFAVVQTGELSIPAEELADLEWLSHFVEDSFSGFSSPFPAGMFPGKVNWAAKEKEGVKPEVTVMEDQVFKTPAHARARRSQRSRTSGKGWSPSLSETSSSGSSSSSYNCITSGTVITMMAEPAEPPAKKRRKWGSYGSGPGQTEARRCSHCGVQKTPQWRAGPLGLKTLCNACGVRFKSGRLFPEYRPACSPTFSSELHSNHHRKVLEMRRKKEPPPLGQSEPGFAVPSF